VGRRADSCQSTTLQFDGPLYRLLVSLSVILLRLSEFSTRVLDKNNLGLCCNTNVLDLLVDRRARRLSEYVPPMWYGRGCLLLSHAVGFQSQLSVNNLGAERSWLFTLQPRLESAALTCVPPPWPGILG
jgi:hypothetical protein